MVWGMTFSIPERVLQSCFASVGAVDDYIDIVDVKGSLTEPLDRIMVACAL